MPKVSIVIPCYNGEKTIACCVKSLLRQTFEDLEVIVVNDGSTDKTEEICTKIAKKDKRVKLITKKNAGRMLARYTGYQAASGEYICFTDADDYHPKDSIQKLYDLVENKKVDCVIANCFRVFGSLPYLRKKRVLSNVGKLLRGDEKWIACYGYANNDALEDHLPGEMWGRIYKKSCIDQAVAADPEKVFPNSLSEDWWFNLTTLAYLDSMYISDEVVYYYRDGGSSTGDYPFLERNNGYFEFRHQYFSQLEIGSSRDELLLRTFICFSECLITEAWQKINTKKYSDQEILAFIQEQLSRCSMSIQWMSDHASMIPASYQGKAKLLIEKDSNGILSVARDRYEQVRSRKRITGPIFRAYDGLCNVIERLFGGIYL